MQLGHVADGDVPLLRLTGGRQYGVTSVRVQQVRAAAVPLSETEGESVRRLSIDSEDGEGSAYYHTLPILMMEVATYNIHQIFIPFL